MPGRYTTKIRAKRIELDYFKRLHPFRRWRLILTIALPTVAAVCLAALAVRGDQRIYNSGPVSTGHAMFNSECGQCHVAVSTAKASTAAGGGFWLRASDQACLKCHDGPIHHVDQAFNAPCASCHVEHKGHVVLASISSAHCTQCHAELEKTGSPTPFATRVDSFTTNHPEFAVAAKDGGAARRVRLNADKRPEDAAKLSLNHQKHLVAGLRYLDEIKARQGMKGLVEGPGGLQLRCTFCHQPDGQQQYMRPVTYVAHCGPVCHELKFDEPFPAAPHDAPPVVRAFVRGVYGEAFDACTALGKPGDGNAEPGLQERCQQLGLAKSDNKAEDDDARPRRRIGRGDEPEDGEKPRALRALREVPPPEETARPRRRAEAEDKAAPDAWVPSRVKSAESRLFKTCAECHTLTAPGPDRLPAVEPTAVPIRWLPHSRFDHGAHRPLGCAECHRASSSTRTEDVLMPSIATCRECHRDSGGARSGCVECHLYHDKAKARDLNGPLGVRELVPGASPAPGSAAAKGGTVPR